MTKPRNQDSSVANTTREGIDGIVLSSEVDFDCLAVGFDEVALFLWCKYAVHLLQLIVWVSDAGRLCRVGHSRSVTGTAARRRSR